MTNVLACFHSPAAHSSVILAVKIIGLLMVVSILFNPHLLGVLLGKLFLAWWKRDFRDYAVGS